VWAAEKRKTASELCAVVVRGRGRRRTILLSLQKGESINLARSLGGFVVLVQAQGLFFFFFIPFLARSLVSHTFFFLVGRHAQSGEYSRSWMLSLVRMR
jgi:hypothetical protein